MGRVFAGAALPSSDDLLDRYIEASGGRAAIQKIETRRATGTFRLPSQGLEVPFEYKAKTPNKRLTIVDIPSVGRMAEGFDGVVGWAVDPGKGTIEKTGGELIRARREAIFNRELRLREVYDRFEVKKRARLDGRDTYTVLAIPREGKPDTLYFDAENGLLVRQDSVIDSPGGEQPIQVYFEEYREVDGVKVPFVIRMPKTTAMQFTIRFTEVKHNEPIDDSVFAKPATDSALVNGRDTRPERPGDRTQ